MIMSIAVRVKPPAALRDTRATEVLWQAGAFFGQPAKKCCCDGEPYTQMARHMIEPFMARLLQ